MRSVLLVLLVGCAGPDDKDPDPSSDTPDIDDSIGVSQDTSTPGPGDSAVSGETGNTEDSATPPDSAEDSATPPDTSGDLLGSWVSEGVDLSAVLAATGVTRAEITFNADGSYMGFHESPAGDVTIVGSWFLNALGDPLDITIVQTMPTVAALNGVATVTSGVLTLDVVQTTPTIGESEATPAGGVGSSSLGADNVQTYR